MTPRPDFKCVCGECVRVVVPYIRSGYYFRRTNNAQKAGAFITSADKQFVLLVQSCGRMWGPPKGSVEPGESIAECAVREVREETGIDITQKMSKTSTRFKSRYYYYSVVLDEPYVPTVQVLDGNDANGVGWFSIECVVENIKSGRMEANQHLRYVLGHFIGVGFEK